MNLSCSVPKSPSKKSSPTDGTISDKVDVANAFNTFFCNIGSEIGKTFDDSLPKVDSFVSSNPYVIPSITPDFVLTEIKQMADGKATGIDGISVKLLKLAGDSIVSPLTFLYNMSISKGVFPSDWKKAKVTPIFKTGDPTLVNNYRPVSVLCVLSKILEKHVHNTFYDYLSKNQLLSGCQFGFRPHHSTDTALLSIVDKWLQNIDEGFLTGAVFIDLRKAFDTVNHSVLLHKLKAYDVSPLSLKFFLSYLSDRSQAVCYSGAMSDFSPISIGVPQGSILGPLLFILNINDYPKCLKHSLVTMYADDTSQSVRDKSIDSLEMKMTEDLQCTIQWMRENKLSLNLSKTQCMLIGSAQKLAKCRELKISVDNLSIETVQSAKLLGVYVDNCLSWKEHINYVSKKISRKIGVLRRLRPFMSNDVLTKVYQSIVFPHFIYCSVVWCEVSNKSYIQKISRLQKRATRILLNVKDVLTPSIFLFKQLKWLPIEEYFTFRKATLAFKILHGDTPEVLCSLFTYVRDVTSRNTRSSVSNKFYIPLARTKYFKRSFVYTCSVLLNGISESIRNSCSVTVFKHKYLQELFSKF